MKSWMKILDWYMLKKMLFTFLYVILIMAIISCVIDYSEKVDAFVKKDVPMGEILNYYKNFIPYILSLLFPLFLFLSTIFFTSKLAYKSEIIAQLSTGISFLRFLKPYVIGGLILCSIAYVFNHYLIPVANKDRLAFEDKYINGIPVTSDRNVHLRLSKSEFIYMESYDFAGNIGYNFSYEELDGVLLKKRTMADRVTYDSSKKVWTFFNVTIRENDGLHEKLSFEDQMVKSFPTLSPQDLLDNNTVSAALTTPQLNQFIKLETTRGRESLNYQYIEKYRRSAQPFAGFLMVIMAATIASRKIRGGSGFHLAIGVAISAAYMMFLQFSNTFSTKGGLDPLVATWLPNMVFLIVTLVLLRREMR